MSEQRLDTSVVTLIDDIKAQYEGQIKEIQGNYEKQIQKTNKVKIELLEYKNKYLEIKERAD